jgi:hypothetical protein
MRPWSTLRTLGLALLLGCSSLVVSVAAPAPAAGFGPLPDCRLDDILTIPRGYDDWQYTLVDWIFSVGKSYVPPDLVSVRTAGIAGGGLVRNLAIADLRALGAAAKANGTPISAFSPYRSYATQAALFKSYGGLSAIRFSARPGHSEHQLGTTIDFVGVGDSGLTSNWEVTRTGAWMIRNSWKYGWILSYPKGKQDLVCYSYEPWHYRYFGRELAAKIHASGLTTREYLWQHYTAVDATTGQPVATATPEPSLTPSAEDSAGATSSALATTAPTGESPGPTEPSSSAVGAILGLDPTVLIGGLALVAVAAVLIVSLGALRRQRR